MARFLSSEWFDEVARQNPERPGASAGGVSQDRLVLRQVVLETPDGDVRYHVVVESGEARISPPGADPGPADLTITTNWKTAVAIAQGKLPAQAALVEGRMRVKGNVAAIGSAAGGLAGLDPVPAQVRAGTTY